MTLQDDVAYAFVQVGNIRKIVQDLVKEELLDFDLEESSGEGWADVSAKTKNYRLLFEIKTHVNVLPTGEIHEENVGGTIRQLKKYRKRSPRDVLAVIIPSEDAGKWAPLYANAGFWVIGWSGLRTVRCPRCRTERSIGLLAPNHCHGDFCGYTGPFEQISLKDPTFVLYERYPPRKREVTTFTAFDLDDRTSMVNILKEDIDIMQEELAKFEPNRIPRIPTDSYEAAKASGLLIKLKPIQFRAIRNLFDHCSQYNAHFKNMIGRSVSSPSYYTELEALRKVREVILQQIAIVRDLMKWKSRKEELSNRKTTE